MSGFGHRQARTGNAWRTIISIRDRREGSAEAAHRRVRPNTQTAIRELHSVVLPDARTGTSTDVTAVGIQVLSGPRASHRSYACRSLFTSIQLPTKKGRLSSPRQVVNPLDTQCFVAAFAVQRDAEQLSAGL